MSVEKDLRNATACRWRPSTHSRPCARLLSLLPISYLAVEGPELVGGPWWLLEEEEEEEEGAFGSTSSSLPGLVERRGRSQQSRLYSHLAEPGPALPPSAPAPRGTRQGL